MRVGMTWEDRRMDSRHEQKCKVVQRGWGVSTFAKNAASKQEGRGR